MGYKLPDGVILDPLGVLEEEPSRHSVKNDHPQRVQRLTDVDSQDPVRFLGDMKRGQEREAHKVRVADVLRMKVELRGGSALKKVSLPNGRPLIRCVQRTFLIKDIGHAPQDLPVGGGGEPADQATRQALQ